MISYIIILQIFQQKECVFGGFRRISVIGCISFFLVTPLSYLRPPNWPKEIDPFPAGNNESTRSARLCGNKLSSFISMTECLSGFRRNVWPIARGKLVTFPYYLAFIRATRTDGVSGIAANDYGCFG